mmetsp:Transcript_29970/g.86931  ORF Transcript_29970/g.86931 Transcript_29970/m.86931 type:complete len:105 (+) Transcript_29970:230-544(+)
MSRVREKLLEVGVNVALGFVEGKEEMQRAAKYLRLAQSCTDTKHSVVPPRALSTARLLQEGVVTKKVQEWQEGKRVMDAFRQEAEKAETEQGNKGPCALTYVCK